MDEHDDRPRRPGPIGGPPLRAAAGARTYGRCNLPTALLVRGAGVVSLEKNHAAILETTFACSLAGTVNAVVNFRLSPDEVAYTVRDAGARILFVGEEFVPVAEQVRDKVPSVERLIVVGG